MSLLDALFAQTTSTQALETTGDPVNVSEADPPAAGQVLVAIDETHAEWSDAGVAVDSTARAAAAAAQSTANTAVTNAAAAQTTANTGVTNAAAAQATADAAVPKATYDANTILIANSDNTPVALTIPASSLVIRKSSGNIVAGNHLEAKRVLQLDDRAWSNPWIPGVESDPTFDDEFDSGDPDFAVRGFTCVNFYGGGGTMTRAGNIASSGTISAGTYRSTIYGSTIYVQVPAGTTLFIYKAFSAAQYLFGARFAGHSVGNSDPSQKTECRIWAFATAYSSANPERNAFGSGFISSGSVAGQGASQFIYTNNSGTQIYNTGGTNTFGLDADIDVYTLDTRLTGTPIHHAWNASVNRRRFALSQPSALPTSVLQAGIAIQSNGSNSTSVPNYVAIDWFRRSNAAQV